MFIGSFQRTYINSFLFSRGYMSNMVICKNNNWKTMEQIRVKSNYFISDLDFIRLI